MSRGVTPNWRGESREFRWVVKGTCSAWHKERSDQGQAVAVGRWQIDIVGWFVEGRGHMRW